MRKDMVQFMVSEDMQDGVGSHYEVPQILGAESHILMLGLEWLAQEETGTGARTHGKTTLVVLAL